MPLVDEPDMDMKLTGELTGLVLDRRYELAGVVGTGGMGTVYEARNLRTGQRCAVKVLLPELVRDSKMRQRLMREIQASSQVRHPNVIEILDYDEDEQAGTYLVMEFLEGQALDQIIAEQDLSVDSSLRIALQLCDALSAIHAHGLVHCDLKPGNVYLLPSGQLKVLDFGLVKPFDEKSAEIYHRITTRNMVYGTPQYMAPEQAGVCSPDPRADIYSLGVMIYEMLLSKLPFQGGTPMELLLAHQKQPVPLPRETNASVVLPSALEVMLLKMLAKKKEDRFESAAAVSEALQSVSEIPQINISSARAGAQARGAPAPLDVTQPVELSAAEGDDPKLAELRQALLSRADEIMERIVDQIPRSIPRYRAFGKERLQAGMLCWRDAFLQQLGPRPPDALPELIQLLISSRGEERFLASEVLGAVWVGCDVMRQMLVDEVDGDLPLYAEKVALLDQRLLPLYLKLIERYVGMLHQNLSGINRLLSQQNEELLNLRNQIDGQLRKTHLDLVEAERVKARVADAISSGLVLVDGAARRVLLFNAAVEKLSGLRAADVLGRPIEEIFHLVEGVPFEEFIDQVRHHGQVGLRKLRVQFPTGREHTLYVSGQPYHDSQGRPTGILFVVEDVTEREKIIESFSRYVSREVSQRILRGAMQDSPVGKPRRAVLMSVGIVDFHALLKQPEPMLLVELLDQHMRMVAKAVFHHGGAIDSVSGGEVTIYFANRNQDCLAPVAAAEELCQRVSRLSSRREREARTPFQVGIGLEVGEVLLVDLGGKQHTVHTVLGEPTDTARALQAAAAGGEILVTEEVAGGLEDRGRVEPAMTVTVPGRNVSIDALRIKHAIVTDVAALDELDPPTLT
jgi:PAS domain S-box-containing protein